MDRQSALFELSLAYHDCRDVNGLLKVFAARLGSQLDALAVHIWIRPDSQKQISCRSQWFTPGTRFELAERIVRKGSLVQALETDRAIRVEKGALRAEALAHLSSPDRERVKSALYAPIPGLAGAVGVAEVLNKRSGEFTAEDAAFAEEAGRITSVALANLRGLEEEHHSQLATIDRLTQLYDISRVFNSTLELEDLLPIVADRIRNILEAQACNLWLVDAEANQLYLAQKAGEDPTTEEDERIEFTDGLIGGVAEKGEARLVADAEQEELLAERREAAEGFAITSLVCAPLLKQDEVLGVVEVINRQDGSRFDEDALFFLQNISEQAAIALNNANLLVAERKVSELDALLAISKEITSTLNLDHVLSTVVNQASTVLPFDQCAIGIFDRGRFVLGAVSGEKEVPRTPEMGELRRLLEGVAEQTEAVSADHYEEGWEVKPEGEHQGLTGYLEAHGYNGFYALPLRDEQGTLGVLALLSSEAEFLSENHLEVLSILASQATIAIRNARLYQDVPLMRVWEPLLETRQKLGAVPHARRVAIATRVGVAALLLVAVPWKLRIATTATVVPAERRAVSAEVEGVVKRVAVREGEAVVGGSVLAELDDADNQVRLERARAQLAIARRDLAEAGARRDFGAANQARLRVEMGQAEVQLYQQKVEQAQLRAPTSGVVVTPKVEQKVGQFLRQGEIFCELVEQERMAVEANVLETDVSLVQPGAPAAIKLNAFPTHVFEGQVERVGAQTVSAEGEQFFVARAIFANPGGLARSGMVGRAKISATGGWFRSGWYPVGYVMLRTPGRWAWEKVWSWLP